MTDARYPEAWLNDRRIVRLSDAAHRLFVASLAWCASNRTDGAIDHEDLGFIHGVDSRKAADLVAAGLWRELPTGWQVVDYEKTQTTRAQLDGLDRKRHQDRERKARERARKRGAPEPEPPDEDLSRVTSGVTSDVTQRQGKDRTGQASTGSTDQTGYTAPKPCPHGYPNGLEPDPWLNGRAACPACAAEMKEAS
jgi:hypothetical protein